MKWYYQYQNIESQGIILNHVIFVLLMSISDFAGKIQHSDSFAFVPLFIAINVNDLKELFSVIQELKEEIKHLEMLNRTKDERIQELECLQNPYSNDGDAICNFEF